MHSMNIITTTTTTIHRRRRLCVPLLVGATLLLGACGGNDGDSAAAAETVAGDTVAPSATIDASGAAETEPAKACGLLDLTAVDAALGTSGVTTSLDTSLGLFDGCRWATARTDVPALLVGYDPILEFGKVRDLACDGTTPEPVPAAGADAVACFGVVVAPAGTGVILVSIDDQADQWDDATELNLAAGFAVTAGVAAEMR